MNFLEIATRNAARGFRVFPVHRGTKQPCIRDFPDLATTDQATIEQWAKQFPDANCGVMGDDRFLIVDTDRLDKFRELFDVTLLDTYCVSARENRCQFTFLQTERSRGMVKRNLDYAVPGEKDNVFEFKSYRKFGMGEGSIHKTGATYQIIQNCPIIPVPDAFITRAEQLAAHKIVTVDRVPVEKYADGGRHNALVSEAGRVLRVTEMSKDVLLAHLEDFNAKNCDPPLENEEVRQIATSCNWQPDPPAPSIVLGSPKVSDWHDYFHTKTELENAPPIRFLIDGFLQADGVTAIAAPVRERKSLIALNVAHALLTGEKLFGRFEVTRKPDRVLYLCPEVSLGPFTDRVKKIGLMEYAGTTFYCRTMNSSVPLSLDDETFLAALPGTVVFLDTAIRFLKGDENSANDVRAFADSIFALLRHGADAVILLHHSPKDMGDSMTLESAMRGSGDMGAFLQSCWGTRLQDPEHPYDSASYLMNLKQRDFESEPFEVTCGEDCRMRIVERALAVPVALTARKQFKGNRDGNDQQAIEFLKANPTMSGRTASRALKEMGINRSKDWVNQRRYELMQLAAAETS